METKYYTPTLDEFYVGFEYEICYNKSLDKWSKKIHTFQEHEYPDCDETAWVSWRLKEKKIRVKYLDKQDIEELGWQLFSEHPENETKTYRLGGYINNSISSLIGFPDIVELTTYTDKIIIQKAIFIKDNDKYNTGEYDWNIIFKGYIKNKSELKKLMKQLKIE